LAPVEGTVTKGGRPLANVQVIFLADVEAGTQGPRTSGTTDESGHYRLRTENGDDGAVVGKHRILLIDAEAAMKRLFSRPSGGPRRKETARLSPVMAKPAEHLKKAADVPRLPPSYQSFSDTPLRAEIYTGPQTINFDVP
jgi:hypothetical protein